VIGGRNTGWLKLPPQVASLSWWQLALGGLSLDSWPHLQLTHLWFLYYYLACLSALFLAARWLVGRLPGPDIVHRLLQDGFRGAMSSRLAPLVLAIAVTPLLAMMKGPDVDTPDQILFWSFPVLVHSISSRSLSIRVVVPWCFKDELRSLPRLGTRCSFSYLVKETLATKDSRTIGARKKALAAIVKIVQDNNQLTIVWITYEF